MPILQSQIFITSHSRTITNTSRRTVESLRSCYVYDMAFHSHTAAVYGLFVVECLQIALTTHDAYKILGAGWGDPLELQSIQLLWLDLPVLGGISTFFLSSSLSFLLVSPHPLPQSHLPSSASTHGGYTCSVNRPSSLCLSARCVAHICSPFDPLDSSYIVHRERM